MGDVVQPPGAVQIIRDLESRITELERRTSRAPDVADPFAIRGTRGVGTDNWPGGSDTTTGAVVTHGLGATPGEVFIQSSTILATGRALAINATTFSVTLRTTDGSAPAAGAVAFSWLALF